MKDKYIRIEAEWIEMVEPLYETAPEKWAEIVALALLAAHGQLDTKAYIPSDPELQSYWGHTRIRAIDESKQGLIAYRKKQYEHESN